MPESIYQSETNDTHYNEIKNLRSSTTNKRLRRLRVFERTHYKKTFEVKKTGHNLEDIHRLYDGNLRYAIHNLTYSLNKKKRWLLPDIIRERICEFNPNAKPLSCKKGDELSSIDERLKITMYENENVHHSSTCIRYANNQTVPHVLYSNGRRFNSATLTKWINFDTRERWNSRHRNHSNDRINQTNFGIQQRPGFFPSEVTYKFLYPKRLSSNETHRNGKSSLQYFNHPDAYDWNARRSRDTNQHRRKLRRFECMKVDLDEYEYKYDSEEQHIDTNEFVNVQSNLIDENDKWSIVFEESDDQCSSSVDFPIEYFFPSIVSSNCKSRLISKEKPRDNIYDRKAHKYFEPWPISNEKNKKSLIVNEDLLCSIPCQNESDFLSLMQQSTMKISQGNHSPPIFLQRTSTSTFSVTYSYCRTSSTIEAILKFADLPPNIAFNKNDITLNKLIELTSKKLDEYQTEQKSPSVTINHSNVDALRGSLPLPLTITQNMILVRPNSTDKLIALKNENLIEENCKQQEQWYNTLSHFSETLECSICCDPLTFNETYQLLPCLHTLCHSCLTSYIRTSISSATYSSSSTSQISCFEQNCSTKLNSSLLQAFLPFEIYQTYEQALIDRHLFSSGNYRKCPSRICSKLLILDDKTNTSLMCSCGQRICSECGEEYHFPASCKQYKTYVMRLRESGDDLLSSSKVGDNSTCYIAEGKNCPNCGEFVEKNGGCPHMTCKCGSEYCWMCLKRWSAHNYATCVNIAESTHELRSSTRNRLHNKAINHRRERNQYSFHLLSLSARNFKIPQLHHDIILSTYIDLNTLAEFVYVLLQRRRSDINIRAVLARTAKRLENDAFQIKLQIQANQIKMERIEQMRLRLQRTCDSTHCELEHSGSANLDKHDLQVFTSKVKKTLYDDENFLVQKNIPQHSIIRRLFYNRTISQQIKIVLSTSTKVLVQCFLDIPWSSWTEDNEQSLTLRTISSYNNLTYFIQWIEFHRLIGISKFVVYNISNMNLQIYSTINLYEEEYPGLIDIIERNRSVDKIQYDCFLHYGDISEWFAFINLTEYLIPPILYETLPRMLNKEYGRNLQVSIMLENQEFCSNIQYPLTEKTILIERYISWSIVSNNPVKYLYQPRGINFLSIRQDHLEVKSNDQMKKSIVLAQYSIIGHDKTLLNCVLDKFVIDTTIRERFGKR
ncbi:unnamed protein product [Rotaria socialis]